MRLILLFVICCNVLSIKQATSASSLQLETFDLKNNTADILDLLDTTKCNISDATVFLNVLKNSDYSGQTQEVQEESNKVLAQVILDLHAAIEEWQNEAVKKHIAYASCSNDYNTKLDKYVTDAEANIQKHCIAYIESFKNDLVLKMSDLKNFNEDLGKLIKQLYDCSDDPVCVLALARETYRKNKEISGNVQNILTNSSLILMDFNNILTKIADESITLCKSTTQDYAEEIISCIMDMIDNSGTSLQSCFVYTIFAIFLVIKM